MAIFYDAPVTPEAQTAFVREVPVPADLVYLNAFPRRDLPTNTVDFSEIVRTNRAAKYRSFDGRIHVSERDAGSGKQVSLLPLSTSLSVGELERLKLQFAQTSGTNQAALANAVYNDAENLTREVQNRLELAWGDVLTDGKLTVNENGLVGFEADFGLPVGHTPTAAILWSANNATPLTDLIAWHTAYIATNGARAGAMRTSDRVIRALQRNAEIVANVHGTTSGKTRVTRQELATLLDDENLPPLVATYDMKVDVDGVSTSVVADDRVLFTPANLADLGYTAWGVSATALELVQSSAADFSFEEAPGIVGVVEKVGPPYREFTFVDAVAMPILSNARRLLTAKVFA